MKNTEATESKAPKGWTQKATYFDMMGDAVTAADPIRYAQMVELSKVVYREKARREARLARRTVGLRGEFGMAMQLAGAVRRSSK